MTMNAYINMLGGYKDRVARIALFDVFYHLENKQHKDDLNRPIDYFGIGLLTVLFFFENMLLRNKKTGVHELTMFLKEMTQETTTLSDEGYQNLGKTMIEALRPASGKRLKRAFYNYETRQTEEVEYAILRADEWDAESQIQYYTLDEQGLELIFATKEYFSEFQISISQLMLRKQLEKGEFSSALRQVDEMRINVHTIKDKMQKIKHEIQRNIISDDTYDRYKEIINDINRRLKQEHDEFKALVGFIHETKQQIDEQNHQSDQDVEALGMIVRIDNELAHVHYLHASLLKESIELKTTAIEAAGESLYYAGVTSFNFDQEVARKLTTSPLPFTMSKILGAPFMKTKKCSTWSLLTVFDHQMLDRPERHIKHEFLELEEEAITSETIIRQQVYHLLFKELLKVVGDRTSFDLKEVLEWSESTLFGTREFCDLWIIIHQLSPMSIPAIIEIDDHIFSPAFRDYLGQYKDITITELEDIVQVREHYSMKNMRVELGGDM